MQTVDLCVWKIKYNTNTVHTLIKTLFIARIIADEFKFSGFKEC